MPTRNGPTSTFLDPPDAASYDALADLFLGPASTQHDSASRPATVGAPRVQPDPLRIELLVMGHLPVRANPWAAQYARAVADLGSPVALVRAIAGEVCIDLFGVRPERREFYLERSLDAALARARAFASHWIVQCDESDPASPPPLDRAALVTLLCAGNEASVLAAFQSLKSLAAALEHRPRVALRVAVMGAEGDAAASIAARLRQSADLFLKRRVDAAPNVGKMGPTGGAPVYRGATHLSAEGLLDLAAKQPVQEPPRDLTPTRPREDRALPAAAQPRTSRSSGSLPSTGPWRKEHAPADPAAIAAQVPSVDPPSPLASASTPGVAQPAAPARGTLVHRVKGLSPLDFRCPDAPAVEFARDQSGVMHLLLSSEGPEALHALTSAHAWATKNIELLRRAAAGPVGARATPALDAEHAALHLFTAWPKRLRGLLDSRVRVHLLASVEVEGKMGWCCVELN